MESVFKFKLGPSKPKYHPTTVNAWEANFRNLFRSLWVNKYRYLKRWVQYCLSPNPLKQYKKMSKEELSAITAIARPGELKFNPPVQVVKGENNA